jgi:hypothetical protein
MTHTEAIHLLTTSHMFTEHLDDGTTRPYGDIVLTEEQARAIIALLTQPTP